MKTEPIIRAAIDTHVAPSGIERLRAGLQRAAAAMEDMRAAQMVGCRLLSTLAIAIDFDRSPGVWTLRRRAYARRKGCPSWRRVKRCLKGSSA